MIWKFPIKWEMFVLCLLCARMVNFHKKLMSTIIYSWESWGTENLRYLSKITASEGQSWHVALFSIKNKQTKKIKMCMESQNFCKTPFELYLKEVRAHHWTGSDYGLNVPSVCSQRKLLFREKQEWEQPIWMLFIPTL